MYEALITGTVAIIVCLISSCIQLKSVRTQNDRTAALLNYRLEELEKKVDKHNSVVERTYKLEELTSLQEEKIKVINHRIGNLEREE